MGWLSDWLGGSAKMQGLPADLRHFADQNRHFADRLREEWDKEMGGVDDAARRISGDYDTARGDLSEARDIALQMRDSHLDTWGDALGYDTSELENRRPNSLAARTIREISDAGGDDEREYWRQRARDAVLESQAPAVEAAAQMAARYGGGGAASPSNNPALAAMILAGANSAGNQASWDVFDRGRSIRRDFLPTLENQRGAAIEYAGMPAQMAEMMARLGRSGALVRSDLIQQHSPIATLSGDFGNISYDQNRDIWGMENAIRQHNSQRRSNIINKVQDTAKRAIMAYVTGGTSEIARAAQDTQGPNGAGESAYTPAMMSRTSAGGRQYGHGTWQQSPIFNAVMGGWNALDNLGNNRPVDFRPGQYSNPNRNNGGGGNWLSKAMANWKFQ